MSLDYDRLCVELHRLDWARELDENVVDEIAASAELLEFEPGQVVIPLASEVVHVYFVVTGRLEAALFDRIGKQIHRDVFARGSVLGLFSVLLAERSYLHVEAIEPTTVCRLTLDEFLRLTSAHRDFQLSMLRIAANLVKRLVTVDRDLPKPAVIAVFHHSNNSRSLTRDLTRRLRQLDESPCMAGDDDRWKPDEGIPYRPLYENGVFRGRENVKELLKEWAAHGRLFVDLRVDHSHDELSRVISYADAVLWCVEPKEIAAAIQTLKGLVASAPRLSEKVRIVWILNSDTPAPPYVPDLLQLASRDFKTYSGPARPNQGGLMSHGLERIIHHLRGVQIGLALGGGAARGMAHLGVLKCLEEHGIYADMIAGTSAGAMTGVLYASGGDPEYFSRCFKSDLTPSRLFRMLPASGYWYLLWQYRRNKFDAMLRKYLDELRMEQLMIPVMTVSVDLVDGSPMVRDSGDSTHNILESINLPPLSLPIVRSGQALVDGGLLNNVPANELAARGCNFVIASTVSAQLEKDFMGIRSKKNSAGGRFFTTMQVVLRQYMIQGHSMNAVGVEPADFVIAPNVTSFDLSEFTRADEMAVIGEQATNESVARLKGMLGKLDPKLFCSDHA
jgi:NTE family protein